MDATDRAATVETRSLWEDFVDIFVTPSEVFARRVDGRFLPALLLAVVVSVFLGYSSQSVLADVYEAEMQRGLAQSGQEISAEQLQQMRSMSGIFATVGVAIFTPLSILLTGVGVWAAARLLGATLSFAAGLAIASYAYFPRILQLLAGIAQGLFLEPRSLAEISLSPARFLDPGTTPEPLLAALARLDLFLLWSTFLLGLGLHVAGRIPRAYAYPAAAVLWLLGFAPAVLGALFR